MPTAHRPPTQVSLPSQTLPLAHEVPSGTGVVPQPKMGSHASVVHGSPSLHVSGAPAVHAPAWHVSVPLQTVPSVHDVPFRTGVCVHPVAGLHPSVVQMLASLQLRGVPAVHVPL
jgi:hypothetical protein